MRRLKVMIGAALALFVLLAGLLLTGILLVAGLLTAALGRRAGGRSAGGAAPRPMKRVAGIDVTVGTDRTPPGAQPLPLRDSPASRP